MNAAQERFRTARHGASSRAPHALTNRQRVTLLQTFLNPLSLKQPVAPMSPVGWGLKSRLVHRLVVGRGPGPGRILVSSTGP